MPEHNIGKQRVEFQSRPENRDGLQMCAPVTSLLRLAQEIAHIVHELDEWCSRVSGVRRMNFVPQIPCEDRAVFAPTLRGKPEAIPDQLSSFGAERDLIAGCARAAIGAVVRVTAPVYPHPKRVVRRQQDAKALASK